MTMANIADGQESSTSTSAASSTSTTSSLSSTPSTTDSTTSQARPTLRCPVVACSVPTCQDGRQPVDSRGCLLCSCDEPSTITAPPCTSAVTSSSAGSPTTRTTTLPTSSTAVSTPTTATTTQKAASTTTSTVTLTSILTRKSTASSFTTPGENKQIASLSLLSYSVRVFEDSVRRCIT